jgi:XTP/dITP diphosphohydrolase
MELLVATRNAHKTREFAQLLGNEFKVVDLDSFPQFEAVDETGGTFAENAILKAISASEKIVGLATGRVRPTGGLVLADDSGLEVDALGGAPGIYSARYAGENATDEQNVTKLLRELESMNDRSARFRCVLALARGGKLLGTFEGVAEGVIVDAPRGSAGFGYDPIFAPTGFEQTFAELRSEMKNQISHRAKAIAAFCAALRAGNIGGGLN